MRKNCGEYAGLQNFFQFLKMFINNFLPQGFNKIVSLAFTRQFRLLSFYNTIPTFNDPGKKAIENIVGKGENAGKQHFLLFPQCFYTLSQTNFSISATFKFSSANALNLDKSNNLSFGKELKNTDAMAFRRL